MQYKRFNLFYTETGFPPLLFCIFAPMKRLLIYIIILLVLSSCVGGGKYTAMRKGLDSINTLNRNDQPFTSAGVQPYVDYFDDHGTSNEQVLAHYLLGRAYHEHGEAPMALKCYQEATERADTTATDCDYKQLSRVYGQMADIFYYQSLYRHQLIYNKLAEKYAWKGEDTLAALMCYEQESFAYASLGDMDSAIAIIDDVAEKYLEYGYPSYSAVSLGTNIIRLLDKGDYMKAKKNMDIYESHSGYFDSVGNIGTGREIYYKAKGRYYLYIGILDSADYWFRKELRDGRDFDNQHAAAKGLVELYQRLHQSDSVAKYSVYAYAMSDSAYARRTTKEVERMQAMYDYTRHQEIAHKESVRADLANDRLLISLIVLLTVFLVSSWLYIARKKVIESLKNAETELNEISIENLALKQDADANRQLITENEKRIKQLEKKLGKYGKLIFLGAERMENDLKKSPNYQSLQVFAYKGQKLSESHWDIVNNLINEYYPGFYDFIISNMAIDSREYKICLLLRLHFKASEIANMLAVTPPYISKTCTEILESLYGKQGSSKELSRELCKIN